jgi:hypothetical protein
VLLLLFPCRQRIVEHGSFCFLRAMDLPNQDTSSIPTAPSREVDEEERPPVVPPLTGLAVFSLVLGILSLMSALLLIPAVGAVLAGHMAIHKIRHANREMGGHRLAVTGLVMGYISIVMFSVLMLTGLLLWPKISTPAKELFSKYEEYQPRKAMRQASELFRLCEQYARDHSDDYPTKWSELEKGYSNSLDMKEWLGSVYTDDPQYQPAFELIRHERPVFQSVKHRVAVILERAPPEVEMVVVMFADGHSELLPNPAHD